MHSALLIAAAFIMSANDFRTDVSYHVTLKNGDAFYAFVDQASNERVHVYRYDEVKRNGTVTKSLKDVLDEVEEQPDDRARRLDRENRDAGNVKVPTPALGPTAERYVPEGEVKLATRAAALEKEYDKRLHPPEAPVELVATPVATPAEAQAPKVEVGLLTQRGPHIALAVAALVIVGVILKYMVFAGNE